MKRLLILAALTAGLLTLVANSDAATTWVNGTAGLTNESRPYTPVVSTSTTETEAAPTSATAGHAIQMRHASSQTNIVVTVKTNILVNAADDAGIYDSTDASAGFALNTFGPKAKLKCWVLDDANGNTKWTRFSAGDKTLVAGDSSATLIIKPSELPRVKRVALVPETSNVPLTITYSER